MGAGGRNGRAHPDAGELSAALRVQVAAFAVGGGAVHDGEHHVPLEVLCGAKA